MGFTAIHLSNPVADAPVSLTEAKDHLHIDAANTDSDTYIGRLIKGAINQAYAATRRVIMSSDVTCYYDSFPAFSCQVLRLYGGPATAFTSLQYMDEDGVEQTISSSTYDVITMGDTSVVRLKSGQDWPSPATRPDAVRATYKAGWTSAGAVPEDFKQALLFLISHWFENREPYVEGSGMKEVPDTFDALLDFYKVYMVGI